MIAIIAILASLMLTSLSQAKERGRRAVCISNLRQFGIAHTIYVEDNRALLETPEFVETYRRPAFIMAFGSPADAKFLRAEALSPYLPGGFNVLDRATKKVIVGNIWTCPSAVKRDAQSYQDEINTWGGFSSTYSYFARTDQWKPSQATQMELLTGKELASERIVMSDQLFHWWVNDSWTYSHGTRRPSLALETGAPNGLAGLNQLFGDGRVVWKSGKAMKKSVLSVSNPEFGFVQAFSSDATFY